MGRMRANIIPNLMDNSMRAFFGLSPDPSTKLAIEAWRNKAFPDFDSPVVAANFHVTLAFLGQVLPKNLDQMYGLIESMPAIREFDVTLDHLGYWSKPKALWLGCEHAAPEHVSLAKQLNKIAKSTGLNMRKEEYIAHLTLARKCKVNPPAPLITPLFTWQASQFHLFESVSGPHGVTYIIRQSWPLEKRFAFQNS